MGRLGLRRRRALDTGPRPQWWHDRARLREWITTKHRWSNSDRAEEREAARGLADYLAHLDGALHGHLRIYSYVVDNHISPTAGERLPAL